MSMRHENGNWLCSFSYLVNNDFSVTFKLGFYVRIFNCVTRLTLVFININCICTNLSGSCESWNSYFHGCSLLLSRVAYENEHRKLPPTTAADRHVSMRKNLHGAFITWARPLGSWLTSGMNLAVIFGIVPTLNSVGSLMSSREVNFLFPSRSLVYIYFPINGKCSTRFKYLWREHVIFS